MLKKIIVTVIISFCITVMAHAQKCPPSYEKGRLFINEVEQGFVCYLREPDPYVENNVYRTKYTFRLNGTAEMYVLYFLYYKSLDSISIVFNNPNGMSVIQKQNGIKLEPNSSLVLFRDYKANDTAIKLSDDNTILFNIPEPEKPYVTVNQFQMPDNETVGFSLDPINTLLLELHNTKAKLFYCQKKPGSMNSWQFQKEASSLKREIRDYRDSVNTRMKQVTQDMLASRKPEDADEALNEIFKAKMDTIFKNYYKNIFMYRNDSSIIEVTFICDEEGKITKIAAGNNGVRSINTAQIRWLEDSTRTILLRLISKENFHNIIETMKTPPLMQDFNYRFFDRINKLNCNPDGSQDVTRAKTELRELIESVRADFDRHRDKEVRRPTQYKYTFKYQSIVLTEDWVFDVTRKGYQYIGPKVFSEVPLEIKTLFRERVLPPDRKQDDYKVKRCFVKFNDVLIGEDLTYN